MPAINVIVSDATDSKNVPVELPDDVPVNKLITILVDKLKMPKLGRDNAPMSYKFHQANPSRQLQDGATLAKAGVKNGDRLRLQAELHAG